MCRSWFIHPSTTWSYWVSNGWCTGFCFLPDGGGGMDGLHHIQFRYLCSATNIHIFVDTSPFTKRADSVCLGDHVMYEGDTN
jgi:hypothetical protein